MSFRDLIDAVLHRKTKCSIDPVDQDKVQEVLDDRAKAARKFADATDVLKRELRKHPIDDLIDGMGGRRVQNRPAPGGPS